MIKEISIDKKSLSLFFDNLRNEDYLEVLDTFKQNPKEESVSKEEPLRAPWDEAAEAMSHASGERPLGSFFEKLPFGNLFSSLPFFKGGRMSFGTEELIICAIALFLLFSQGGDKECAIMLFLLLWIR